MLDRGTPDSLYLNFAVFCLSVFVSFLISLLTTHFESRSTFDVFVIVTVVTGLLGTFLLILWFKSRRAMKGLIVTIRSRLQVEGVQESPPPPTAGSVREPLTESGDL